MNWKKKLTKKQMTHVRETTNAVTLDAVRRNFDENVKREPMDRCHECVAIGRRLGW